MLKNIISTIFLISVMASPTATMAASTQAAEIVNITDISNEASAVLEENVLMQATTEVGFQAEDTSNVSSVATGWMFTFALLGFVLLSNRRGV